MDGSDALSALRYSQVLILKRHGDPVHESLREAKCNHDVVLGGRLFVTIVTAAGAPSCATQVRLIGVRQVSDIKTNHNGFFDTHFPLLSFQGGSNTYGIQKRIIRREGR